jgi:hypothetical protein
MAEAGSDVEGTRALEVLAGRRRCVDRMVTRVRGPRPPAGYPPCDGDLPALVEKLEFLAFCQSPRCSARSLADFRSRPLEFLEDNVFELKGWLDVVRASDGFVGCHFVVVKRAIAERTQLGTLIKEHGGVVVGPVAERLLEEYEARGARACAVKSE